MKDDSKMLRSRRSSLTGIAYHIAMRIREVAKPFTERDEEVPRDLLAGVFKKVCDEFVPHHGGQLTTDEMKIVAEKWVPRAIAQMDRREQTKEGFQNEFIN
jgi:hypothetical protein